ncbi:MAG: aminoacyl-tRNA hydrolase [Burkholderiales bacterium]|nr:aminoacyl-tRNA hydrolase [Burkholderiales bacterium]
MSIRLIVGLGNIGPEYEDTRHNAGFWLADLVARSLGAPFRREKGFHGELAKAGSVFVLKPSTYMNRSGQAVGALAAFYKIAPEEILVAHDELDLPPGTVKIKQGGGHAGHNGLKDIQARLGSPDFWRVRIGIGHPRELGMAQEVADFVLHRPGREHRELIDQCIDRVAEVIPDAIGGSMQVAMMKLHAKKKPA